MVDYQLHIQAMDAVQALAFEHIAMQSQGLALVESMVSVYSLTLDGGGEVRDQPGKESSGVEFVPVAGGAQRVEIDALRQLVEFAQASE